MVKLIRKGKKKKGFTLIELVAVVAIIGILAAILVPKIAGYMNEAKKTKVIDQSRKVLLAVETYNMKNDTNKLKIKPTTSASDDSDKVADALTKGTVKSFIDPEAATNTDLTTNGNALDKLLGTMSLYQCKQIVEERKDFTLKDETGDNGRKDIFGAIITDPASGR